jgi:hypothetical protein
MSSFYKVQVSPNEDFTILVINKIVETVSFTVLSDGLDYGTQYWWRVKCINNLTGQESEWSAVCEFVTEYADIICPQNSTAIASVIVFEASNENRVGFCFPPDTELGVGICLETSGIGELNVCNTCTDLL